MLKVTRSEKNNTRALVNAHYNVLLRETSKVMTQIEKDLDVHGEAINGLHARVAKLESGGNKQTGNKGNKIMGRTGNNITRN